MYEGFERFFWKLINPDKVLASDILQTIMLTSRGTLSHIANIKLGMSGDEVRNLLRDCILREHKKPLMEIDLVLSANAWPEIYRYILNENVLISVIVEIGIDSSNFQRVYSKIESKMREVFAYSIEGHKDNGMKYPSFLWEYSKHFCYFQVLSDKTINFRSYLFDTDYFGFEVDGTFIRKPGKKYMALPTIALIFAKNHKIRLLSIAYLQIDIAKRNETTSLLNMPAIGDQ